MTTGNPCRKAVWNGETGTLIHELPNDVLNMAFSTDDKYLLINMVKRWKPAEAAAVKTVVDDALEFSPTTTRSSPGI